MKLFFAVVLAVSAGVFAQELIKNADLVIVKSKITPKATFFPIEIDEVKMEVLAVKAPDGTIRTAFNTCQVCHGSGKAYFKQEGAVLVCQNCKRKFKTDEVEISSGGCSPVPIFAKDKIITENTITIKKEYLRKAKELFENWQ